jgi:proteasome lid subunit RPN8/RPN11
VAAACRACYIASVLRIAPPAWRRIAAHAARTSPEEACGILVGRREGEAGAVLHAEPCRNIHEGDRRRRFLIDPERQLAVQREARQQGLEIVGFYHSHPEGAALPSAEDARMAHPGMLMLIVALRAGRVTQARAWRFAGGGWAEVALEAPC